MKKIFYFLIGASLIACTDDDTFTESVKNPVFIEETMLGRANDIHTIDIPGDADWEVTENPFWAVPMEYEGTAGTPMKLFVETNFDDEDRIDTLTVLLANGSNVAIPLRQHGLASSNENASDITLSAEVLEQTCCVGFGVDVIDWENTTSEKYNLKSSPFNLGNVQQVIDKFHWDDAIVGEPVYFSRYESVTGSSTDALSNQLGINAGIDVGIKAFKFSVEAGYSSSHNDNSRYQYALLEMQHIVESRYFRGGLMNYMAEHDLLAGNKTDIMPHIKVGRREVKSVFQSDFYDNVAELKEKIPQKAPKDSIDKIMFNLVSMFGTHVIYHGTLGGELKVSMKMKVDENNNSSNIHAALGLSAKVVNVKGEVELHGNDSCVAQNTTISLRTFGGNNAYTIAPGTTFKSFQKDLKDKEKMDLWVESIKSHKSLSLIDMETIPLWDLMPTKELRDSLRNYIVRDYQKSIAQKHDTSFSPDLYLVEGYDVTNNTPGRGSIYIPELDLQIDVERRIIEGLDKNEFSTVVYSGQKGQVDKTRGFFVGSPTRKPCKFHIEKNGDITIVDEFERLPQASISQLYVDVTGEITIATKSIDEMYQVYTFTNWKHDLSMLTSDWTFKEDIAVTGKTDHCIHIADGKTLTLDNVTVNNQIVCDGNATIILKDGTKNSVISPKDSKAGIQVGTTGKTLTISGNGELETQGGKNVPGIGGSGSKCGNITITGGVITAKAGTGAGSPGIGGSWGHPCGNITITNGTVTAVGSNNGPGIGASAKSSCGNIEISGGTVTATGTFCAAGIGTGWEGKCADITISGGTVKAEGGGRAAGIGSGCGGQCGNITITKGVKSVKATCGMGETCVPIGVGDDGLCGTVTIESGANVEAIDPYKIELDKLTEGYTVMHNAILRGHTSHIVKIADGVTVTLAGISMTNTLDCLGNATIVLGKGTDNRIRTPDATSTLRPGPAGTRLIIEGEGKLFTQGGEQMSGIGGGGGNIVINGGIIEAHGGYGAAGIGSDLGRGRGSNCGDITINGGEIFAYGGEDGAGIGSGTSWDEPSKCGNILINGGRIYARSGRQSVAIGSGSDGICGNITIKKTVTQVTIVRYDVFCGWIGSLLGTCGTVTIEEGANVTKE